MTLAWIVIRVLKLLSKQLRVLNLQFTIDIAVAGKAGLFGRFPVVVLSAALTMGPISVVSAAHTVPPTASAAVLLHVKHALV